MFKKISVFAIAAMFFLCGSSLSAQEKFLEGKTLWTLFDSLGDTNDWQRTFCELSGCRFYPELNRKNLSYGGTSSAADVMNGTLGRAKMLVALKDSYPIDIIMISNTNDLNFTDPVTGLDGSPDDEPWMQGSKRTACSGIFASREEAERYCRKNLRRILRETPQEFREAGNMYVFPYYDASSNNGNHIRVLSPSEKGGKVCFRMGRNKRILSIPAGMGLEQTRNWLASQFYGSGWTAVDNGDDSYSISYYIEKNHTVGFDPMDSGLELEITESPTVREYVTYFIGKDASSWRKMKCWTDKISIWSCYKGLMEYLTENLPDTKIYWFMPSYCNFDFDAPGVANPDGSFNEEEVRKQPMQSKWIKLSEAQRKLAEMYGAGVLEVEAKCGIGPHNFREYFDSRNPHPKMAGYERWGETLYDIMKSEKLD